MISTLFAASLLAGQAFAWGNLGHETVGYVAMAFLQPNAASFVATSLAGSTYNASLGVAATWADSVKYSTGYTWSQNLHFLDAEDDPLDGVCNVMQSRDCSNNVCILTAISNYTTRIQDTSLSSTQRQEALKFLDHFLGDIGQPLHVEAYEVGGNDISTTCGGSKTNLHATWDTGMLTTNINANYGANVQTYANSLITRIQSGDFKSKASSWISCQSITATQSSKKRILIETTSIKDDIMRARTTAASYPELQCPLIWAQESNAYDCTSVFDYTTGTDLCSGTYYNNAIPIIDLQLAKQGYRLAMWLSEIFDGVA